MAVILHDEATSHSRYNRCHFFSIDNGRGHHQW